MSAPTWKTDKRPFVAVIKHECAGFTLHMSFFDKYKIISHVAASKMSIVFNIDKVDRYILKYSKIF